MSSKLNISALMNSPTPTDEARTFAQPSIQSLLAASAPHSCNSSSFSCHALAPEYVSRTSSPSVSLASSPPSPTASCASFASVEPSNGSAGTSTRSKRKRTTKEQLKVLNEVFQRTYFPSTELRLQLAAKLNMTPRSVQTWFQNQRQVIRQTSDKLGSLIDGRKRKYNPNDNFSLDEPDVPSQEPKKAKSDAGSEASRNQEWRVLAPEPLVPSKAAWYRSPQPLPSSVRVAGWLDHFAAAPVLPLPMPIFYSNDASSAARPASFQHFVSCQSNPGDAFIPFNSHTNKLPCLNPKISTVFRPLPLTG